MDLSIIIVNWNTRDILHHCLLSIYAQTEGVEREVIVIDNGSTDGSVEMIKRNFREVILVENAGNRGFAAANNQGIKISKGRYVCLVNSDIIVLEYCIQKLMSFIDEYPSIGIVGPRIVNPDGSVRTSCNHFPTISNNLCQALGLSRLFPKSTFFSPWTMDSWSHDSTRSVDVVAGSFWMVRRKAIDEVGLLDEDFFIYGEDIDWCKRFHNAGWDVVFYPGAEAIHLGGASSNNAPVRFYLEMQKADLQYWRKHHGKSGELIYWLIILLRQLVRMPIYALMYVFCRKKRETAQFKLKRAFACICFLFGFDIDK